LQNCRKQPLAVWLISRRASAEAEGFGTRIASIEVSSEGRRRPLGLVSTKREKMLKTLAPLWPISKRPKIVHDPKVFQLLTGEPRNIQDATQLYSYLLRPTTANHNFADAVMRQFSSMIGGGPGERADYLQRLAPALQHKSETEPRKRLREIDLPLAAVLANIERAGDPRQSQRTATRCRCRWRRSPAAGKEILELSGSEFNVNSPAQLAEFSSTN